MKSFINAEDGSNLTDISPILTCIRTLSECDAIWNEDRSKCFKSVSLKQLKNENDVSKEDGFYFAVSLRDGTCLFTSSAVTDHLGFPKDMLSGQCFMNFVFQKDHITFANHLTQGLNACFVQNKREESHLVVNSFFCRLRVYQGLKFGYSVSDKKTQYKPFKITLHINELIVDDLCVEKSSATLCVKATANIVSSAYTIPEEIPAMTSFSTRHTASCHFSHVDSSAIPYLGYLPQDMIGFSVFNFYHIDDLPQLKEIYEFVVKEHGTSFRSKPYRFRVQNGCYIMLETEWSCFINPWSHKLEFVVGQHRVLKGPPDVNIFNRCEIEENIASEEILKEGQKIQKEIISVLSQSIKHSGVSKSKRYCNKRKRDLASFVYNCIDEGYVGNKSKGNAEKQDMIEGRSHCDPDSVVMGNISPYREVNDSSVSSETPPTVLQLRYQGNIERFFASQPKTYSDGSDEYNKNEKSSSGEEYQTSSSGSGNGSGVSTSKDPDASKKYENKIQQSSNSSSKCNMSSFTTGDSGYGKSTEKNSPNNPSVSHAESCNQEWKNSDETSKSNAEKFSSCMALTKEVLSAHNRINHKHLKHHQRKNKSCIGVSNSAIKNSSWFQTKDSGYGKHKKGVQSCNMTVSTPTQTDINVTPATHFPLHFQPPTIAASSISSSAHLPTCLIPTDTYSGSAPASFFIPVVYMGSVPYYPPISAVHPQTVDPFWTSHMSAPASEVPASTLPFPVVTPCSHHANVMQPSGMAYPTFPFLGFNPFSGIPYGVQSSGVTATSPLATTTTTIASGVSHAFKNTIITPSLNASKPTEAFSKTNEVGSHKQDKKVNECGMQVDDTRSSSFTHSSFLQSANKEDMDFDVKICPSRTSRSNKIELSPEIAYRYQMNIPNMDEVLKKDMEMLKVMQQPELVNKQLQMLQNELKTENENKAKSDSDFCITEPILLGLAPEDDVNEELEYREECLLRLMCEDL